MAERLAVDDDELAHFMKLLKNSGSSLRGLHKALSDPSVTGLGTDDLDAACESFQEDSGSRGSGCARPTEAILTLATMAVHRSGYRDLLRETARMVTFNNPLPMDHGEA